MNSLGQGGVCIPLLMALHVSQCPHIYHLSPIHRFSSSLRKLIFHNAPWHSARRGGQAGGETSELW